MALKSVLITGCSSGGIGSSLVSAFQERNMHVFATARDPARMSHLVDIPNVTLLTLDPTSAASVESAIRVIEAQTGGTLDVLVNNAGQVITMPILDTNLETAKSMFEINIWGMLRVTQAFAPLVIAAKGTIVNISSVAASLNTPWIGELVEILTGVLVAEIWQGLYAAPKAAVTTTSDTLRLELAPFGVKVVTVNTGAVRTNTLAAGVNLKLPHTSKYITIEKEILARAKGEDGTPRMEASVFAKKVVDDTLGGTNGPVWRGSYASIVRLVTSWLPMSIYDSMSVKGTGLDTMKA